jgi:hypothetical protein
MSEGNEERQAAAQSEVAAVIDDYQAAKRTRRRCTLLAVILILGALAYVGFSLYFFAMDFYEGVQQETRRDVLEARFEREIKPKLKAQWKLFEANALPKLRDLAEEKADVYRPQIKAVFDQEFDTFQTEMWDIAQKKGEALFTRIIEKNQDVLQAEFPDIRDPEKMHALVTIFAEATNEAAVEVFLSERLAEHIDLLNEMRDSLNQNMPVRPASETDTELLSRFAQVARELVIIKTSETPTSAPPETTEM